MADRVGTLVANTPAVVELADAERVEVLNRDGTAEIWVRVGDTNPTVASTDLDVFCVPAVKGAARVFSPGVNQPGNVTPQTVRLISGGTPTYSVQPL